MLSSSGLYTAYINVPDPKTGERIPLTVKDAFVFVWYAFCMSNGVDLSDQKVPKMFAQRVQRIPLPMVDDLMSVVDNSLIDRSVAVQALANMSNFEGMISTEAFYNKCTDIYNAAQKHRQMISMQEHHVKRGMVHGMVSRIFSDQYCTMVEQDTYFGDWFRARNIDIGGYSTADLGLFYVNIVQQATGLALTTQKSLKDLQAAMLRILSTLSSYAIQLSADINSADSMMTNWTAIRIGDVDAKGHDVAYIQGSVGVQSVDAKGHTTERIDVVPTGVNKAVGSQGHMGTLHLEVGSRVTFSGTGFRSKVNANLAPVRVRLAVPLKPNSAHVTPVVGIDSWLALPEEDRLDFTDEFGNVYVPIAPAGPGDESLIPLAFALPITLLNGLFYDNTWPPATVYLDRMTRVRYLPGFDKSQ
jgi:hypothetical protein